MYQTLMFSIEQHIATITFNRPEAMNTFNQQMAEELEAVTEQVRHDASVRAVLVNGAGPLFMAGGDISFFAANLQSMPRGVMKIMHALNAAIIHLMEMPKPVLASVHGSVAGVGMSIMMACDLIIAAESTKFTMAYSGIGITPDGGATYQLPRLVGTKKAMEWLLLSEVFTAETAHAFGLVNWVVAKESLAQETARLLQRLANGPTRALADAKRLVNQSWQQSLETQLAHEATAFAACTTTTDFRAGVSAFLGKKAVAFQGE